MTQMILKFLILSSLFIIQSQAIKCNKNSDCPGYSIFDGFKTTRQKPEGFSKCCFNKCIKKKYFSGPCPIHPSKTFPFICADGRKISLDRIKNKAQDIHNIRYKIFEKCMINAEEQCPNWPYAWKRNEDSCTFPKFLRVIANDLDKSFDGACIMHDLCYNNVKTEKKQCDDWFKENIENMCSLMMAGTGGITEKMFKFICDKLIGISFHLSVHFGGKADKLWTRKNCIVNKNARYYVTIHSPNNAYIIAGIESENDKPDTPKIRIGNKAIGYYLNDAAAWSQFIFEKSNTVENGYYIRSYIGAYLKCETNLFGVSALKHSIGTDKNAVFFIEPVAEFVRFRNIKNEYIYVADGKLKCSKDIKKANKWKMDDIQSPGPKIFVDGVEQNRGDGFFINLENVYIDAIVGSGILLMVVSCFFCFGVCVGWTYHVKMYQKW